MYTGSGFYAGETVVDRQVRDVFVSEDALSKFVSALDCQQRGALYELLYLGGQRFTGRALADWGRKGGEG